MDAAWRGQGMLSNRDSSVEGSGRKLEGCPASAGHLQRTARAKSLWEMEKDDTRHLGGN